jgi:hypothetical protein
MITQLKDTSPEVEKLFISLLRNISTHNKLWRTLSFSSSIINLSKRAISRTNPLLSEKEKGILFVKFHYGDELADKLRKYLEKREYNEY